MTGFPLDQSDARVPRLRAVAVAQPWAWAVANGWADVINVDYATHYRGTVLIVATHRPDKDLGWPFPVGRPSDEVIDKAFAVGAAVAIADLADVGMFGTPWCADVPFNWKLTNVRPLEPLDWPYIPAGLVDVPPAGIARVNGILRASGQEIVR